MELLAHRVGNYILKESELRGRPMTRQESEAMLHLMFLEEDEELHQKMMGTFMYAVIHKRLQAFGGPVLSMSATAFLSYISGGSPGNAVLLCAVVHALAAKLGKTDITLNDIVEAFPFLIPSDDVLHAAWDSQKGVEIEGQRVDNGLDYPQSWGVA